MDKEEKLLFNAKFLERDWNEMDGCCVVQLGIVVIHVTLSILLN